MTNDAHMKAIVHKGKVYFSERELRCKKTGVIALAPGFADRLLELRLGVNQPMIINSACRSKQHNESAKVKGHPRSLHVYDQPYWPTGGCCAVDVKRRTPEQDEWLMSCAWRAGFSIGVHSAFIHLDLRTEYIPKSNPKHYQTRFKY
jgi:hypothetical protein